MYEITESLRLKYKPNTRQNNSQFQKNKTEVVHLFLEQIPFVICMYVSGQILYIFFIYLYIFIYFFIFFVIHYIVLMVSLWHPGAGRDVRKKPLPYNYFFTSLF